MTGTIPGNLKGILKGSEFLKRIRQVRDSLDPGSSAVSTFRALEAGEIRELESHGNYSTDWALVMVHEDFTPEWIMGSTFMGACVLGKFTGSAVYPDGDAPLNTGIYRSTVINSRIGSDSLVCGVRHLAGCSLMDGAIVYHVNTLSASGPCTFGNGIEITVGNETGGRIVRSFAEITAELAAEEALRPGDKAFQTACGEFTQTYTGRAALDFGVVESGALIRHTTRVSGSYIGSGVLIDGAVCVINSTILGSMDRETEISHGAYVAGSCVQKGCRITTMAIADTSIFLEGSHAGRHAKVTSSIIGPATGIDEGEVTCSLVGPLVSSHHQAMLISAIWPGGRGNIGYGANVGSNHTSRQADQEIFPGEGTFFGLGVNIKFPSDLTAAPYSIIATGLCTQPQRVEFPFSLINSPSPGHREPPRGLNEIIPGWVITNNFYSIRRNEDKFRERALPGMEAGEKGIVRPDIIDLVIPARNRLRDISGTLEFYTPGTINGLGKNFLSEKHRLAGLDAYDLLIKYYALSALKTRVHAIISGKCAGEISSIYSPGPADPAWEHARSVLISEGLSEKGLRENLESLCRITDTVCGMVQESRERDHIRGSSICSDYESSHVPVSQDSVVAGALLDAEDVKNTVKECLNHLPGE